MRIPNQKALQSKRNDSFVVGFLTQDLKVQCLQPLCQEAAQAPHPRTFSMLSLTLASCGLSGLPHM